MQDITALHQWTRKFRAIIKVKITIQSACRASWLKQKDDVKEKTAKKKKKNTHVGAGEVQSALSPLLSFAFRLSLPSFVGVQRDSIIIK